MGNQEYIFKSKKQVALWASTSWVGLRVVGLRFSPLRLPADGEPATKNRSEPKPESGKHLFMFSSHLEGELESLRFGLETSKVVIIWVGSIKDSAVSARKEWSFGLLLVSHLALLFCFVFLLAVPSQACLFAGLLSGEHPLATTTAPP